MDVAARWVIRLTIFIAVRLLLLAFVYLAGITSPFYSNLLFRVMDFTIVGAVVLLLWRPAWAHNVSITREQEFRSELEL